LTTEPVQLADGSAFEFWEPSDAYTRTYHVSANHPAASDDNPGAADLPWRTIQRAAEALQPGERVLIGEGVYRERVTPPRGGTGPNAMICYEAAPGATRGARAVIKGSQAIPAGQPERWTRSKIQGIGPEVRFMKTKPDPNAVIWRARLPRAWFSHGYNPFAVVNRSQMAGEVPRRADPESRHRFTGEELAKTLLKRGMVYQDGRRLRQVAHMYYLGAFEGSFWVESNGLAVHVRPFGDVHPSKATFEFTTRQQVFAPETHGLGYIRVKGLAIEQVADGWALPPEGALSTHGGHHWAIEGNSVREVNASGIEVGVHREHVEYDESRTYGYHIVRGNRVAECGLTGLSGTGLLHCLVEGNEVWGCAWHRIERNFESAGIKFHAVHDSLLRRNVVHDIVDGSGIWLDAYIQNSRLCENLVYDVRSTFGGIFVELSRDLPNWVDHNVVLNVEGHGIYEHDCDRLLVAHNLVAGCTGAAVMLRKGEAARLSARDGRGSTGRKHRVHHNLLIDCGRMVEFHNPDQRCEHNVYGKNRELGPFRLHGPEEYLNLATWREFCGFDLESVEVTGAVSFDREARTVTIELAGVLPRWATLEGLERDYTGATRGATTVAGPFRELGKQRVFAL
jgi:hypothetical protein